MKVFGGPCRILARALRYRLGSFTIVNNMGLARKFIWVFAPYYGNINELSSQPNISQSGLIYRVTMLNVELGMFEVSLEYLVEDGQLRVG